MEGLAAAATTLLVGVAEGEARLQLVLDVVHLGTDDEHAGLRVDQDRDALVLNQVVEFHRADADVLRRRLPAQTTRRETRREGVVARHGQTRPRGDSPRRA